MRAYESKRVVLFQKRLEYGNINHDPKFQYIAKKIQKGKYENQSQRIRAYKIFSSSIKKKYSYTYEVSCELRDLYKKVSSYYEEEQKKVKIELTVVDSKKIQKGK